MAPVSRTSCITLSYLFLFVSLKPSRADELPRIFLSNAKDLAHAKQLATAGDPAVSAAVANLRARADKVLIDTGLYS